MIFDTAFDRLMLNEGGYSNNRRDRGGETSWGISKVSYPHLNIRTLTKQAAKEIYFTDFWIKGRMDQLNSSLAFQIFDAAVNHGIKRAHKLLQRSVGITEDGVIGPLTLKAIGSRSITDLLMLFIAARIHFFTSLSSEQFDEFGAGWMNRMADNLVYAAKDS